MTPSLQQAIKLLQMSKLELQDVLTQEIVENPLLEEKRKRSGRAADGSEVEAERLRRERGGRAKLPPRPPRRGDAVGRKRDSFDESDFDSTSRTTSTARTTPAVRGQRAGARSRTRSPGRRSPGVPELAALDAGRARAVREDRRYLIGNIEGTVTPGVRDEYARPASRTRGRSDGGARARSLLRPPGRGAFDLPTA